MRGPNVTTRGCHSAAMAAVRTRISRWRMPPREWQRFLSTLAVSAERGGRQGFPGTLSSLNVVPALNLGHGVPARANLTSIPATPGPPYLPSRAQRDNHSLEPALQVRWVSRRPWGPRFGDLRCARTSCLSPLFLPSHGIVPTRGEGHTAAQPYDSGLASRRHPVASARSRLAASVARITHAQFYLQQSTMQRRAGRASRLHVIRGSHLATTVARGPA
jgi:hypothetical protein